MAAATFEGAVELGATANPTINGRMWMETAVVACPRQHAIDGARCLECPRFINVRPSTDHASARVRCLVTSDDPVRDHMTPAVGLAAVGPETAIYEAYRYSHAMRVHHLLVTRGESLVGLTCRCQLLPPILRSERVADRMATDLWVVGEDETLGQATAIMRDANVGLLPVIRDNLVVGVVSRGDMVRVGADQEELSGPRCPDCGESHRGGGLGADGTREVCVACFEALLDPEDFEPID